MKHSEKECRKWLCNLFENKIKNYDMINNIIKRAEYKLSQHRQLGRQSNMSIFEVANLYDTLKKGQSMKESTQPSKFNSFLFSEN